jgi:hypothetical protein
VEQTEYALTLVLASAGVALALVPIGKAMLGYYATIEFVVGLPFP